MLYEFSSPPTPMETGSREILHYYWWDALGQPRRSFLSCIVIGPIYFNFKRASKWYKTEEGLGQKQGLKSLNSKFSNSQFYGGKRGRSGAVRLWVVVLSFSTISDTLHTAHNLSYHMFFNLQTASRTLLILSLGSQSVQTRHMKLRIAAGKIASPRTVSARSWLSLF